MSMYSSKRKPDGWSAGAVGVHDNDGQRTVVGLSRAVGGSELISEYLTLDEARELRRELKRAIRTIEDPDFWRKVRADEHRWGLYNDVEWNA